MQSGLHFFLWEDLGVLLVGCFVFSLNSKFTFKPLPLEAAGTAYGQMRKRCCLRRAVGVGCLQQLEPLLTALLSCHLVQQL